MVVHIEYVVSVHDSISDEVAVFAEPVAAACKILEQKLVHKDQLVCVVGDGKLGLLICEVLSCALDLKRLVLIGKHSHKMNLAPRNVEKFDQSDMTKTLFNDYFDVVIEATGNQYTSLFIRNFYLRLLSKGRLKTHIFGLENFI